MSNERIITHKKFPKQGHFLNKKTKVAFNFDTSHTLNGVIVRHDHEEPFVVIIKLDNGRYVLGKECQFQPE